jgi:hypothetical protein
VNRKIKNILIGVGSIINIFPASDYVIFYRKVPTESVDERLYCHWQKVGEYISNNINVTCNDEKNKTR